MPEFRRLELGPPSDNYEACVDANAGFKWWKGSTVTLIGPCKIHKGRKHWRVSTP